MNKLGQMLETPKTLRTIVLCVTIVTIGGILHHGQPAGKTGSTGKAYRNDRSGRLDDSRIDPHQKVQGQLTVFVAANGANLQYLSFDYCRLCEIASGTGACIQLERKEAKESASQGVVDHTTSRQTQGGTFLEGNSSVHGWQKTASHAFVAANRVQEFSFSKLTVEYERIAVGERDRTAESQQCATQRAHTSILRDCTPSSLAEGMKIQSDLHGDMQSAAEMSAPASGRVTNLIPYHHNNAATGTWLGYNRANEPNIRSNRVTVSAALTTPPIRLLLGKILQRTTAEMDPGKLIAHMHTCQAAAYEELGILISEIQKGGGNEALDLFFGNQRMAGVKPLVNTHADRTRIDFMNLNDWGRAESAPIDFAKNGHGHYLTRPMSTTDGSPLAALLFHIQCAFQYFTSTPNSSGYLSDLAVPAGWNLM
jgi:hypothetical protein